MRANKVSAFLLEENTSNCVLDTDPNHCPEFRSG